MKIKYMRVTPEEFLDEFVKFFNEEDEDECRTCTDNTLKCKYDYKEKSCESACKEGTELKNDSRMTSVDPILHDKIMADGYKIVNDIKVWVEFARKCDGLGSAVYSDMLDMIKKAVISAEDAKI